MKTYSLKVFKVFAALVMMVAVAQAFAEPLKPARVIPVLNGVPHSKIAHRTGEEGVITYQYVRPEQGFENWQSTVVYSNYQLDDIGDDPQKVATRLVNALQQINIGAKYKLVGDKEGKVLLLDFLSWPPNRAYMEFSAYRIQGGEKGEGVYTLQFSARMPFYTEMSEEVAQQVKALRSSFLQQLSKYDMKKVIQLLREQRAAQEQSE